MDSLLCRADFNDSGTFALVRKAVMKIPDLTRFSMYWDDKDYEGLEKSIERFDNGQKAFITVASPKIIFLVANKTKNEQILDTVANKAQEVVDKRTQIDELTDKLANLF